MRSAKYIGLFAACGFSFIFSVLVFNVLTLNVVFLLTLYPDNILSDIISPYCFINNLLKNSGIIFSPLKNNTIIK